MNVRCSGSSTDTLYPHRSYAWFVIDIIQCRQTQYNLRFSSTTSATARFQQQLAFQDPQDHSEELTGPKVSGVRAMIANTYRSAHHAPWVTSRYPHMRGMVHC